MSHGPNDDNGVKGFSGLDSMVSDISDEVKQAPQVPPDTKESSTQSSQTSNTKTSSVRSESSGFKWIIGIIVVFLVIWYIENSEKQPGRTYSKPSANNVLASASDTISRSGNPENKPVSVTKEKVQRPLVRLVDVGSLCELQERLSVRGYYNSKIDGIYGPGMEKAVSEYERENNQPETGVPSAHILEQLRQSEVGNGKINAKHSVIHQGSLTPRTGTTFINSLSNKVAPLQIATSSNGTNFYVKVQDAYNKGSYQTFFIRGGEKLNTKVPLGTYLIRYAAGEIWHGPQCMFGMDSIFSKADKKFLFQQNGNQIQGYQVELILRRDGNLRTSKISRGQF